MVVIDDIGNWYSAAVNNDATLSGLILGKMVAGRANENALQPYGIFTVEVAGPVNFNSGWQCYPEFRLQAGVYADQNTAANSSAIQQRMTFVFKLVPTLVALTLRNAGEGIVSMQPTEASASFEPRLRNANDVILNQFAWIVRTCSLTNVA